MTILGMACRSPFDDNRWDRHAGVHLIKTLGLTCRSPSGDNPGDGMQKSI